jgi:hypothetical protein
LLAFRPVTQPPTLPSYPAGAADRERSGARPYGAERLGVNGFAVASMILGLIGGIVLAVVFGIVALVQVNQRGQRGKGFAVTGLVASVVWILGVGVVAVFSAAHNAGHDTSDGPPMRPGDCVRDVRADVPAAGLPVVPCGQPHQGEVFAVFAASEPAWPGDRALVDEAQRGCTERLTDADVNASPGAEPNASPDAGRAGLDLYALHPTEDGWRHGDHSITCLLTSAVKRTGSIRG